MEKKLAAGLGPEQTDRININRGTWTQVVKNANVALSLLDEL